jgi:hypothetical protein
MRPSKIREYYKRGKKMKRFTLKSFDFQSLEASIYDDLEKKELHLNIYQIINLLNEISQLEYNLIRLKEDICKKLDEAIQ